MAKKSLIEREKKRQKLERKYQTYRQSIKEKMKETLSLDKKMGVSKTITIFTT